KRALISRKYFGYFLRKTNHNFQQTVHVTSLLIATVGFCAGSNSALLRLAGSNSRTRTRTTRAFSKALLRRSLALPDRALYRPLHPFFRLPRQNPSSSTRWKKHAHRALQQAGWHPCETKSEKSPSTPRSSRQACPDPHRA